MSISALALEKYVVDELLSIMGDYEMEREIVDSTPGEAELAEVDRALKETTEEMLALDADVPALTARLVALKRKQAELVTAPRDPVIRTVPTGVTFREAWERLSPDMHHEGLRAFFRGVDLRIEKGRRGSRAFDSDRVIMRASHLLPALPLGQP